MLMTIREMQHLLPGKAFGHLPREGFSRSWVTSCQEGGGGH